MFLFIDGPACLRMGQFSHPVATHPRTNEVEVPRREFKFQFKVTLLNFEVSDQSFKVRGGTHEPF